MVETVVQLLDDAVRAVVGVQDNRIVTGRFRLADDVPDIGNGYPERYAQEVLGHASAAIHRAYAKSVRVELPPLEEYEKSKVLALPKAAGKKIAPPLGGRFSPLAGGESKKALRHFTPS
jgi:hypothetical protein